MTEKFTATQPGSWRVSIRAAGSATAEWQFNVAGNTCGDAFIDPGEKCDDGNQVSGDGCDATCQSEGYCGDGIVQPPEECDQAFDWCIDCKIYSIIIN